MPIESTAIKLPSVDVVATKFLSNISSEVENLVAYGPRLLNIKWQHQSLYKINSFAVPNRNLNLTTLGKEGASYPIDLFVTDVNIHTISQSQIHEFIGGRWVYTPGVTELRQVDITFRDMQGSVLYNKFKSLFFVLKDDYPDYQRWTIEIYSLKNVLKAKPVLNIKGYVNTISAKLFGGDDDIEPVLSTSNAYLNSVSSLSFNSSSSEVSTFSLTFIYAEE